MSQLTQLSEAEFEDRFLITGRRAIAFTLAGYARDADQFSLHFGGEIFVTTLLEADAERGQLVFDCSGAENLNRKLREAGESQFVGRPEGIHVQFSIGRVSNTQFGGRAAFAVPLPESILRLQRRESFRIDTPRVHPLNIFLRLPDQAGAAFPAHDLSVDGVGLTVQMLPEALQTGMRLANLHFHLSDEAHELYCDAIVRHVTEQAGRTGLRLWRVGLQFADLPASESNGIQRYIARLERERHELS